MTATHLLLIINNTWRKSTPIDKSHEEFRSLYDPHFKVYKVGEELLSDALVFDYKQLGFSFRHGELTCTGLNFWFASNRFPNVSVSVFFDYPKNRIYNSILATPTYTEKDWRGRKNISQVANKVNNTKDVERYLNRLYKRFECPINHKS